MTLVSLGPTALRTLLDGWRTDAVPGYLALADRIRLLVIDGRVPVGTGLPAERELATSLGLSRTTVSAALEELRQSGYLETRRGSGSRVRLPEGGPASAPADAPGLIDLSRAASRAAPGLHSATMRAVERLPAYLPDAGYEFQGLPETREAIAARFRARGVPTTADEIMVTSGAQSAIALVARALLARGDRVLVETPGYPHAFEALRSAGGRLVPVAVDGWTGWSDDLERTLRRTAPAMAYLMPDFHNPTGRSMADPLRERLIAAAVDNATVLVVDETTAELDIDRPFTTTPIAALAGRHASVITIGSASKTLWGGLRIGWIRASRSMIDTLMAARPAFDLGTAVFEQLVVGEMLRDWPGVLEHRRAEYAASRAALATALAVTLPDWTVPPVDGGLSFWVRLPAPASSQLALAARARGLLVPAGSWFGIDGAFERFLRLPFTAAPAELDSAVRVLADAWSGLGSTPLHAAESLMTMV